MLKKIREKHKSLHRKINIESFVKFINLFSLKLILYLNSNVGFISDYVHLHSEHAWMKNMEKYG